MTQQDTQIATVEKEPVSAIIQVIERAAMNPDIDVEKMERLLAMQERIMERNARTEFYDDFARMQSEMPVITEKGAIVVKGETRSRYARFEDIVDIVRPILQKYGFAISFRVTEKDPGISVTGVLTHRAGHREETTMYVPSDMSGSKNDVQALGSAISYGKRYVLNAMLNITTRGEDDDGVAADPDIIGRYVRMGAAIRDNLDSIVYIKAALFEDRLDAAYEAWQEVPDEDKHALWIAPTKGGVFTTEERAKMKSNEWAAIRETYQR